MNLFRKHLLKVQEAKLNQIEDYYIMKNHDGGKLVYKGNPIHNGQIQAIVAASGVTHYFKDGEPKVLGLYKNNDQELVADLKKKLA